MQFPRSPARLLLIAAGLLAVQGAAFADILVQGDTTGSAFFNGTTNMGTSIAGGDLTYSAGAFGPQSSNTTLNLGYFTLSCILCRSTTDNFDPFTFNLKLNFSVPAGTGSEIIAGDLTGKVTGLFGLNSNTVALTFAGPTLFTYSGSGGSGQFYVTVNNITAGSMWDFVPTALTGTISGVSSFSSSPEPGSIALLGTVLAGLAFRFRKRLTG